MDTAKYSRERTNVFVHCHILRCDERMCQQIIGPMILIDGVALRR
jgi:hypothetical protein